MPTLITKGAMSVQALGFGAPQGGALNPYWIGYFKTLINDGTNYYNEYATAITVDTNNNVYPSGGGIIAKINSTAIANWINQTNGGIAVVNGQGCSNCSDSNGNVYYCGAYHPNQLFNGHPQLGFLAKFDLAGNLIWQKNIESNLSYNYWYNIYITVHCDSANNIVVCGQLGSNNQFGPKVGSQMNIVKYDTNGNVIWEKVIAQTAAINNETSGDAYALGGGFDSLNNFYCIIWNDTVTNFPVLIKINSSGNFVWQKKIDMPDGYTNQPLAMYTNKNGTTWLTIRYGLVMKFDKDGNLIWQTYIYGNDEFSGICADSNENVFINGKDIYKLDPSGNVIKSLLVSSSFYQINESGNVFVDSNDIVYFSWGNYIDNPDTGFTDSGITIAKLPNDLNISGPYIANDLNLSFADFTPYISASPWTISSYSTNAGILSQVAVGPTSTVAPWAQPFYESLI